MTPLYERGETFKLKGPGRVARITSRPLAFLREWSAMNDSSSPTPLTREQKLTRALLAAGSVALAAILIVWLIPRALDTSWTHIFASFTGISAWWVLALLAVALVVLAIDSIGFSACFRGVSLRASAETNAVAQAVTVAIPMGSTISLGLIYARLKRAGASAKTIASGTLLASIADILAQILLPILAVTLLALAPLDIPLWVRIALIVAAALSLALTSTALGLASSETLLRTLLERVQTITDAFHEGYGGRSRDIVTPALATRDMAISDAQGSRALILGAPTIARIVQGFAFIAWCTFGYGFTISPLLLFGIYALSRLLALIPLTPGGIGVIDVGVAWALVQCGAPNAAAVSCALTFTLSQVLTPVVAGALAIPVSVHDSRADIARRSS